MLVLLFQDSDGEQEDSPATRARQQLESLLNKTMRIRMTDGRTLVGCFLCTDRDCNVILGSAQEFLKPSGQCPGNTHLPPGNGGNSQQGISSCRPYCTPLFSGARRMFASCSDTLTFFFFPDSFSAGEPRVLGLAMVPGHHIVSIEVQRESLSGGPYL